MTSLVSTPLVSAKWLYQHSSDPNLIILDASIDFQIPSETEKDKENLIPQSIRFDYDKCFCDPDAALPHMMPSEARFNQLARQIGLNNESTIVVYDNSGTFASPRAWWMLKAMGHQNVFVLNGGLTEWKRCGYPTTTCYRETPVGNFNGKLDPNYFVAAQYVEQQIGNNSSLTVDARGKARFLGQTPEPRAGVRSGRIPNSVCQPFAELIDGHKLKTAEQLIPLMENTLVAGKEEYLFSCGSGVTACIVLLAATLTGYETKQLRVYDGSWTEWGSNSRFPIE
ncbi:sulfurtransferase [Vibrio scophthalmi]|uniref:sulfurtransferase n=1 Tax=Vibrio scophthalmi TaxID=45658 RepID=UPI003AAB2EDE